VTRPRPTASSPSHSASPSPSAAPIRAVLFDVGGPLDTEVNHERLIDQHILEALAAEGIKASTWDLARASVAAVASFAPSAYKAILWTLASGDRAVAERAYEALAARAPERQRARGGIELRPGVGALLRSLHGRGLLLGLAANQPQAAVAELDRFGIGRLFSHREVSGHHGYRKPDVRLFLRACDDLGVAPAECLMVGDRIDNDIVPTKLLGMRTVLFRTGRHAGQLPRSLDDLPDAEVSSVEDLAGAIDRLLALA
jgi:putative hydrolase of the HAD superfamily